MKVDLETALKLLRQGQVLAVPTDTVYGLAVDFTQKEAVKNLFALKGRAPQQALILLAAQQADIEPLLHGLPAEAQGLMERFWPGALTLVLPVDKERVPKEVRADGESNGFRIPAHVRCRELLMRSGPLAVTSANRTGSAPAHSLEELEALFGEELPILEGGEEPQGRASTVLVWQSGTWTIGREGSVTFQELQAVLPGVGPST